MEKNKKLIIAMITKLLIVNQLLTNSSQESLQQLKEKFIKTRGFWFNIYNQEIFSLENYVNFKELPQMASKNVGLGLYKSNSSKLESACFLVPPYQIAFIEPIHIFDKK